MIPDRVRQVINRRLMVDGASTTAYYNSSLNTSQNLTLTVVFVINHIDKSTQRYRVFNYADELARIGVSSRIVAEDKLRIKDVSDVDIVIFNRICWSQSFEIVFELLRQKKIPTVFDIDDLIFDPGRHDLLRGLKMRSQEARSSFLDAMPRWRRTLMECDLATVSTFGLRREVERLGKPAFVLPNIIGREVQSLAENLASTPARENHEFVEIAYFSGTRTHEIDFAVCKFALMQVLSEKSNARLHIIGELEDTQDFARFEDRFVRHPLLRYEPMLKLLSTFDIVLAPLELNNAFTDCKSELKVFEPALFSIPCIASPTSPYAAIINHRRNGMLAATRNDWYSALTELVTDRSLRENLGREAYRTIIRRFSIESAVREAISVYRAAVSGNIPREVVRPKPGDMQLKRPAISVIAILYNKEKEVRYFLESLRRQDISDRFEVILIDDASPDSSVEVVEQYFYWNKLYSDDNMDVIILRNDKNLGNCASRNLGVQHAKSDVVLIVDADCVFNPGFLSSHLAIHQTGYCDVAIGPRGIETGNEDPFSCLGRLELDLAQAQKESRFQDPVNLDSFVNCVTRNFSIRRSLAADFLFDEAFTYNASPESGFGWEDIELGCRLYEARARIRYLPDTISLHVSHPSTAEEKTKPLRSLRNFRRLHEKHPDLMHEARQWTKRTYAAIVKWANANDADIQANEDFVFLENKFKKLREVPFISLPVKPLRVLSHRWHVSHQYELYRLGHQFNLVTGAGTKMCDAWDWEARSMPSNARFVPYQSIDPRDYDLMILHFDENLLHPERCHNKVPLDWGKTFLSLLEFKGQIPTIAVCHGTPQFKGQYDITYKAEDLETVDETARKEIVNLLRDVAVVCNSHQAREEWKFVNSRVIWHGFSPHDFPNGLHDRGVGGMLERAMLNRPHYNGYFIYKGVKDLLDGVVDFSHLEVPIPGDNPGKGAEWATVKFHNYVRELGRFSIYFNPTKRSPMPRLRGEAMMTGAVTVNFNSHDVDKFIVNGVNGFYGSEPRELAEQIEFLVKNPDAKAKISRASRLTAMDIFNHDRYLADWTILVNEVMSGRPGERDAKKGQDTFDKLFTKKSKQVKVPGRKDELLYGLNLPALSGVEIGPLDKPIVLRNESSILYADHADTQSLRKKYSADASVNVNAIPEIDIVLSGNNLADCIGRESVDYIIASHVIEHAPDFVGFLLDCYGALRTDGVLCLAVPDCRYTFDVFRRQTFLEDVEVAHESLAKRPSLDQVIDHAKNIVEFDQGLAWTDLPRALQSARLKHPRSNIPRLVEAHQSGEYMDVHCWIFTPWSFLKLTKKVCEQYKLPMGLRRFVPTRYMKNEFLVQLEKLPGFENWRSYWSEDVMREQNFSNILMK